MKKILIFLLTISFIPLFGQDNVQKNIILIIGDGMGVPQITAGMYKLKNQTALENFPIIGLSKTHSSNALITDSAAAGTAIACGEKTANGTVGISMRNQKLTSILELSKQKGYKTGIIATSTIVHATPAAFYANVLSRNQYEDIALQLSDSDVDYFIGGGRKFFLNRKDKRNLLKEMTSYDIVNSIKKFDESKSDKIAYLTSSEDPYPIRNGRIPNLSDAVEKMLPKLSNNDNPYFLLIEASQIDWGGHKNDIDYVLTEFIDMDKAINKVIEFTKNDKNTIVIVTGDHETGGLAITSGRIRNFQIKTEFSTIGHSAVMIPVFAKGAHSEIFSGIYDNTEIFKKMFFVLNN
tara:strand:- start:928 stop:1977 length:1050 start_codon:yes stop_codon:yes gene_type:complete